MQDSHSCKLLPSDARCRAPRPAAPCSPCSLHTLYRTHGRLRSAELSGNLRNPSVKSACFVGQRARTAHMLPTHITSHLGNAHILKAFISPFSLLDLSEKFRCQPIYLRKKRTAQSFTDGLPSCLGFDQGKKAAGGGLLPRNVSVEAFVHAATLWYLSGRFPHACLCHHGSDGHSVLGLPRDNAHTQQHSMSGCPWGLCAPLCPQGKQGSQVGRSRALALAEEKQQRKLNCANCILTGGS